MKKRYYTLVELMIVICIGVCLICTGLLGYVIVHFIMKFW